MLPVVVPFYVRDSRLEVQEPSARDSWRTDYRHLQQKKLHISHKETLQSSGSWLPPKSSKPICGNSTTNSVVLSDSEVPGGHGCAPYITALEVLDGDMPQYIHDNTEDEISHFKFINAYLISKGADPVNLDHFRTLPSSKVKGAQQIGRLTNLMQLTVDTSWWIKYRSRTKNPDLGDTFAQAVPGLAAGQFPAIPRNNSDLNSPTHVQAIANTAGFHFAFIEQGGTSLYPSLAQRVTNPEVLRILLSIGPTEMAHFQTWHDKAGNAPALTDPTNGLVFPDLNASGSEDTQTNLIMPEPTAFLSRKFPPVSIIRPTETTGAAMGALQSLISDGLFRGQSKEFSLSSTS